MLVEKDLSLFVDLAKTLVYTFTQGEDKTPYDLSTASDVRFVYQKTDSIEVEVTGTVSGANNNIVTFILPKTDLDTQGHFRYYIWINRTLASEDIIAGGDLVITDSANAQVSLDTMIKYETPAGLNIDDNFKNIRIRYWRELLQQAFDITDIVDEEEYTFLQQNFIAKLVVYDAILLEIKNLAISVSTSSSDNSSGATGAVKKVVTGPAEVEFHNPSNSISSFTTRGASGKTPLEELSVDICGLASKLQVHLKMCDFKGSPVMPVKQGERTPTPDSTTILKKYYD